MSENLILLIPESGKFNSSKHQRLDRPPTYIVHGLTIDFVQKLKQKITAKTSKAAQIKH